MCLEILKASKQDIVDVLGAESAGAGLGRDTKKSPEIFAKRYSSQLVFECPTNGTGEWGWLPEGAVHVVNVDPGQCTRQLRGG